MNRSGQDGNSGFFRGRDFWAPNVNIFRDPLGAAARRRMEKIPSLAGGWLWRS
jgi:hypothetical protein